MLPFRVAVIGAPISVATKLTEDTMTYLNQGQAYEIKLENITDVEKKGFMCSIINIGFHERHMQQAENELWQQWSQQHPDEKIFSVDMKLSYNVFGVESDGLNKCEFLWDSSKAAGVFIRINSISTEFTPRKHGGEKGVPFKLSIETFSYNSKTHDSYFIAAACCQIKVFKPKGAERKIRSDREKISKKPPSEQEKYHKPCDHTTLKECSLSSLHPMADGSLCYYRHSHGHFASKQIIINSSVAGTPNVQANSSSQQDDEELEQQHNNTNNGGQSDQDQSPEQHSGNEHNHQNSIRANGGNNSGNEGDTGETNGRASAHQQQRDYHPRNIPIGSKNHHHQTDYSASRLMQSSGNGNGNSNSNSNNNNSSSSNGGGSSSSSSTRGNNSNNNHYGRSNLDGNNSDQHTDNGDNGAEAGDGPQQHSANEQPSSIFSHHNHSNELSPHHSHSLPSHTHSHPHHQHQQTTSNAFNHQMYHHSSSTSQAAVRGVASLVGINNPPPHFGMAYYGHTLPNPIAPPSSYGVPTANNATAHLAHTSLAHPSTHGNHNFPIHPPTPQQHISSKGATSILRQLSHDKQLANHSIQNSNTHHHHTSTPFKASNLAITHCHNNSFQTYLGNHSQLEQCGDDNTPPHDLAKDGSPTTTDNAVSYQHENYDLHLHHSSSSSQQPFRQRSASTSLTITNVHCSNYMSHGNQARHLEVYGNPTSSLFENSMSNTSTTANHWMHGPPQLGNSNSICNQRTNNNNSDSMGGHHHNNHDSNSNHHNHHYNSNHNGQNNNNNNYDCSDQNYDSDQQNSPNKSNSNHHNQANDTPMSCFSRFKCSSNSIMTCQETTDQSAFDNNIRMGQQQQQQHHHHHHLQQQQQQQQQLHHSWHITVNSSCSEVVAWFAANRFGLYTKTFSNFSGSDLLRLSKTELIEICGLIDGIRLYNSLHNQPIKPGRVFYICHTDSDIFHPIYLYDVTLKELLRELSVVFNSHFVNNDSNDHKSHLKGIRDKPTLNSNSSNDSRSSMEDLSTETGADDVYGQGDFFDDIGIQRQQKQRGKHHSSGLKSNHQNENNNAIHQQVTSIDRLLIDGITSVKIAATEQVVQMLENESVWTLSLSLRNTGLVEACMAAQFKRNSK